MSFLYASFLIALLGIAVPIIIHLFQFRRFKRVPFSSIRFLEEIVKEKKKSNNLKHFLLLALRCLAIIGLVIGFAMPFFKDKGQEKTQGGRNSVAIYIDNSFSMEAKATNGNLLNEAILKAEQIAKNFKESDRFLLVTNNDESKFRHWISKNEFLLAIHQVNISPAVRDLGKIFPAIKEAFSEYEKNQNHAYFISDFQTNLLGNFPTQDANGIKISFLPLKPQNIGNVFIDSVWIENPVLQINQQNTLKVTLENSGAEEISGNTISLKINGQQKGISNFSIQKNANSVVDLPFTLSQIGINKMEVSIQDYPITFDDVYYTSFTVPEKIEILLLKDREDIKSIKNAFQKENAFLLTEADINNVDVSKLKNKKLIICAGISNIPSGVQASLINEVNNGANLLFFPSTLGVTSTTNQFLKSLSASGYGEVQSLGTGTAAQNMDFKHPFFSGIFGKNNEDISLPKVKKYFSMSQGAAAQKLIQVSGGESFFQISTTGAGYVFQFATPLSMDFTNLQGTSIFLPLLYKSAFYSGTSELKAYTLLKDEFVNIKTPNEMGNSADIIKDGKPLKLGVRQVGNQSILSIGNSISVPGFYEIRNPKEENKLITNLAFNYDRKESKLEFFSNEQLQKINPSASISILDAEKKSFESAIKESSIGNFIWKYFIILALAFLLTESIIIRFLK